MAESHIDSLLLLQLATREDAQLGMPPALCLPRAVMSAVDRRASTTLSSPTRRCCLPRCPASLSRKEQSARSSSSRLARPLAAYFLRVRATTSSGSKLRFRWGDFPVVGRFGARSTIGASSKLFLGSSHHVASSPATSEFDASLAYILLLPLLHFLVMLCAGGALPACLVSPANHVRRPACSSGLFLSSYLTHYALSHFPFSLIFCLPH